MKVLLSIAYDGTNYFGWQKQKDRKTVALEIENALEKIFNIKIKVLGASRTDSGVHALDQKCVFEIENSNIPIENLKHVLNRFLPMDIRIINSMLVLQSFDLLANVISKTYSYCIETCTFENPKTRLYAFYYPHSLDTMKMADAAKFFVGTHDFIGFSSIGSPRENTVRIINNLEVKKNGSLIYISINGNGFLYNMVRIISGTLMDVGCGKINPTDMESIILSKERKMAGKTAKAKGLTLEKIFLE